MRIEGYYYLHTNGDLIFKRDNDGVLGDFRESDFVRAFWPVIIESRESAWDFLVEAASMGANKDRVNDLIKNWKFTDDDAKVYCSRINVNVDKDGNAWCVTKKDFVNPQESPCGYGDTIFEALVDLCKALGFQATKLNWHASFQDLCKV